MAKKSGKKSHAPASSSSSPMTKRGKYTKHGSTPGQSKHRPPSTTTTATTVATNASSSLAQRLKKYRGTAANTPPPPSFNKCNKPNNANSATNLNFLTPNDNAHAFETCLKTSYAGFYYDSPQSLLDSFHRDFEASFDGMEKGEFCLVI